MRVYRKEGYEPITAAFGPDGESVLAKLGYIEGEVGMATKAKKTPKPASNGSREDNKELAAALQRHLKTLRPDFTLQDMRKVGSAFYLSLSAQVKKG